MYCAEGSPENFYPGVNTTGTSFDANEPIYNRIVEFERGGTKVIPSLAEKWDISPDPFRIPWGKLKIGLNTVIADVEAEKTPALEWELWLRKKVIGRIPGA